MQLIWNYLIENGLTQEGTAGLMGNLYAESGLNPINLQNTYNNSLNLTDNQYTKNVDNKTYNNFIYDKAGYGIAQWTYWSRKKNLYDFAQKNKESIGDLNLQLAFLVKELKSDYKELFSFLCSTKSVKQASNQVLLKFEKPANTSIAIQQQRQKLSEQFFNKYQYKEDQLMINIDKSMTSTHNTSSAKNRKIEYIVLHYTAGTKSKAGTAANNAKYFATTSNQVSADFIVDDGTIVQYNPDIKNRYSWAVGGAKYNKMSTSEGGKYYGICKHSNSINIEMCSNKKNTASLKVTDTDWYLTEATVNNAAQLVQYLMKEYNINIDHVIMHHHVTGKVCPQPWTINEKALKNWQNFLEKVNAEVEKNAYPEVPFQIQVKNANFVYKKSPLSTSATAGKTGLGLFTIDKVQGDWGHLKSGVGWVYLKNTAYYNIKKETTKVPYTIQITGTSVYIREKPKATSKATGIISDKKKYTIIQEKDGWGLLKSKAGWISLKYTKEVK